MPTRKAFCQCCLAALLAGLNCRRPLGGLAGVGVPRLAGRKEEEVKKEAKKQMVATCGLVCDECPAYIATQKNDNAQRAETAKKWSQLYHADIQPADINCDGCQSASPRLFHHCFECEIRACALEKKVSTCAACPEYSCQKLDGFLAMVPEARAMLEELRKGL
jgi:hypothetical protein